MLTVNKTSAQMATALYQRHPDKYNLDKLMGTPVESLTKTYLRYAASVKEVVPFLREFAKENGMNPANATTAIAFYKSLE